VRSVLRRSNLAGRKPADSFLECMTARAGGTQQCLQVAPVRKWSVIYAVGSLVRSPVAAGDLHTGRLEGEHRTVAVLADHLVGADPACHLLACTRTRICNFA
jgi:hypothetical protein